MRDPTEDLQRHTYFGMKMKMISGGDERAFETRLNEALSDGWGMCPDFPWDVKLVERPRGLKIFMFMMVFKEQEGEVADEEADEES